MDKTILIDSQILSIHIDDLSVLHCAYMPFLLNGGIFLASLEDTADKHCGVTPRRLNEELCLLLRFFDEVQSYCCIAKVVWITPARLSGGRCAGIGLQFSRSDRHIKSVIESRLANQNFDSLLSQTL